MSDSEVNRSIAIWQEPRFLFAYGTLGPRFRPEDGPWFCDEVRGHLFDLGAYPALIALDDARAAWVPGHSRLLQPHELQERLDPYEGVSIGLFRRTITRTRMGRLVWVYVYARPLPQDARPCLSAWVPQPEARLWTGPSPGSAIR